MLNKIIPNTTYAIVEIKVAITKQNPDTLADKLNTLFRHQEDDGFICDHSFNNSDDLIYAHSSSHTEDGEIFEQAYKFALLIENSENNEQFVIIDTDVDLQSLNQKELRDALSEQLFVTDSDIIKLNQLNHAKRIKITATKDDSPRSDDKRTVYIRGYDSELDLDAEKSDLIDALEMSGNWEEKVQDIIRINEGGYYHISVLSEEGRSLSFS